MAKERNVEKFNRNEKKILSFELILFATTAALFGLAVALIDTIGQIADRLVVVVLTILAASVVPFIWAIVRIIRYLLFFRFDENTVGLKRTVIALLLSPITFAGAYILVIIVAFSGCTVV